MTIEDSLYYGDNFNIKNELDLSYLRTRSKVKSLDSNHLLNFKNFELFSKNAHSFITQAILTSTSFYQEKFSLELKVNIRELESVVSKIINELKGNKLNYPNISMFRIAGYASFYFFKFAPIELNSTLAKYDNLEARKRLNALIAIDIGIMIYDLIATQSSIFNTNTLNLSKLISSALHIDIISALSKGNLTPESLSLIYRTILTISSTKI
ncbi:MAG: hypothetical protein QM523_07715 [Candidatus Pacebacteria bacterium]|nr:hypothetical protein [Candidatus Paceibacterota bacterium]